MSRRILLLALALLASAVICAAATGAVPPPVRSARVVRGPFGSAVLRSLNRVRKQHRLPSLSFDPRMSRAASRYSRAMARHGFFSHGAWTSRVAHAAGRGFAIGEVLGWLEPASPHVEARWVVQAWLRSPEHRRVLLDRTFRRVGIGRAVGGESGRHAAVYTVDFASAR
jgi:uncharacterized protein YkwD